MTRLLFATVALFASLLPAYAGPCPAAPPPVHDLNLVRFYADQTGSIIEPARLEQHKAQIAPLVAFVGFVAKQADQAVQKSKGGDGAARCGLSWIKAWADGNAYLGTMATKQAESQRKWDLAGIALAYLKLSPWATADDKAAIDPWLIKIADASRAVFDDTTVKRNNHWYWLGLGLGAVGLATNSETHWQMAKGIMQDAANDIQSNGTLPYEMGRESRALHYHAFALGPLVVMAELAKAQGEDWYAINTGALHRLVAKTIDGLNDPAVFDKLAHIVQERPVKPGAGWLSLYRARFPGKIKTTVLQPDTHRWLGGDVLVLKAALGAKPASRLRTADAPPRL